MRKKQQQPRFSPKHYILSRARKLPMDACYINENWKESGMASILVIRKHSNQNYTIGIYLVDIFALGTKDTFFNFNVSSSAFEEMLERMRSENMQKAEYPLVHNIIYGANAFAEENGFKVHKDFKVTQYILEADDEAIPLIEIEFGRNGEPFLII